MQCDFRCFRILLFSITLAHVMRVPISLLALSNDHAIDNLNLKMDVLLFMFQMGDVFAGYIRGVSLQEKVIKPFNFIVFFDF